MLLILKMSLLKLEELYQANEKRSKSNRKVFEEILKMCHRRILQINRKVRITQCYYKIPAYVFGYPAYKMEDVNEYLCHKLTKNGLLVYPIDIRTIYINWDPEMVNFERYQKTRQKEKLPIVYGDDLTGNDNDSESGDENGSNFGSEGSNGHGRGLNGSKIPEGSKGPRGQKSPRGLKGNASVVGVKSGTGTGTGTETGTRSERKLKMTPNQPMAVIHFDSDFEDMIPVNTKKISARRDENKVSNYPWFGK